MSGIITRRGFVQGLIAAPAIIAIERLMPVKALIIPSAHWPVLLSPENIVPTSLSSEIIRWVHHTGRIGASGTRDDPFPSLAEAIRDMPLDKSVSIRLEIDHCEVVADYEGGGMRIMIGSQEE